VERDKPKKIGIGWTNFSAVAMETKMGGLKKNLDSFWGVNKFKMAAVAMVTKVHQMLSSNRTADPFGTQK
jgi:hypothetical protein